MGSAISQVCPSKENVPFRYSISDPQWAQGTVRDVLAELRKLTIASRMGLSETKANPRETYLHKRPLTAASFVFGLPHPIPCELLMTVRYCTEAAETEVLFSQPHQLRAVPRAVVQARRQPDDGIARSHFGVLRGGTVNHFATFRLTRAQKSLLFMFLRFR